MSSYFPPEQNLAIFDPSVFKKNTDFLTIQEADTKYLRFPNAQGTENFSSINVVGLANFSTDVDIAGTLTVGSLSFDDLNLNSLTIGSGGINSSGDILMNKKVIMNSSNSLLRQITSSYYNISNSASTPTSTGGRIYHSGTNVFLQNFTSGGDLIITNRDTFNNDNVVLTANSDFLSSYVPLNFLATDKTKNRINNLQKISFRDVASSDYFITCNDSTTSLDFTTNKINGIYNFKTFDGTVNNTILIITNNNVKFNKSINLISDNVNDRVINSSGFIFTEYSGVYNSTPLCVAYQSGTSNYYSNLINNGSINLATKNASGLNTVGVQVKSNELTFKIRRTVDDVIETPLTINTDNLNVKKSIVIENLGDYLEFPDGTQQTTAYTGGGGSNKVYTITYASTQNITIPPDCFGISVAVVGAGGIAGNSADSGSGSTWNCGGAGGGASALISNNILPISSGTITLNFVSGSGGYVNLVYYSTVVCQAYNGNNGNNATSGSGGVGGGGQTNTIFNTNIGSWRGCSGSAGGTGGTGLTFQDCSAIPTGAGSPSYIFSTGATNDGIPGCGQRYSAIGGINKCPLPTTHDYVGLVTITYYLL